MSIESNATQVLREVKALSLAKGVSPLKLPEVKVLAVTKNQSIEAIRAALSVGIEGIAENRVQEAVAKYAEIGNSTEWHIIGHLQTNKVRQIVPFCQLIHSVDSENLAMEVAKAAAKSSKRQDVLIQVNVSGEATKFGVPVNKAIPLARFIASTEHIQLCGFMTIAPLYENIEETRPIFRELFQLFKETQSLNLPNVSLKWLSMGMTNDYRIAIEEGANIVRIGTGIFGKRH